MDNNISKGEIKYYFIMFNVKIFFLNKDNIYSKMLMEMI